jgi:hypothetical protein
MRPFTGFPDEQKCDLYNIDGRFFQAKTERKIAGRRPSEVARIAAEMPEPPQSPRPKLTSNRGSSGVEVMESKETRQINEFTLPICDVQSNPVDLRPRLVSAERALAAIRAGSRIYIGTGCAAPRTLLARLEAMEPGPADLEFVSFLTTQHCRRQLALPELDIAIGHFSSAVTCAVWRAAGNWTTCPSRWKRYRDC